MVGNGQSSGCGRPQSEHGTRAGAAAADTLGPRLLTRLTERLFVLGALMYIIEYWFLCQGTDTRDPNWDDPSRSRRRGALNPADSGGADA